RRARASPHSRLGLAIGRCVLGSVVRVPTAREVAVHPVEVGGAVAAEVELAVRSLFRVLGQLPLEVLPTLLVPGALHVALQLAVETLVGFHLCLSLTARVRTRSRTASPAPSPRGSASLPSPAAHH